MKDGETRGGGLNDAADEPVQLWPLGRDEASVAALRELVRASEADGERFWGFDAVVQMLDRPVCQAYYAAQRADGRWLGLVLVDVSDFVADLLYIYVRRAERRHGIGAVMLTALLTRLATEPRSEALLLEVRPSNAAALALYRKLGFREVGRRRRYYKDGEDALVLRRELGGAQ